MNPSVQRSPRPAPHRLVLADGPTGCFNNHGRLRPANALDALRPGATQTVLYAWNNASAPARCLAFDTATYGRERLRPTPDATFPNWLSAQLPPPPVRLAVSTRPASASADPRTPAPGSAPAPQAARARVHRYRLGDACLLAIERNIAYQMSEDLKQAGGNEALETAIEIDARIDPSLPAGIIYDLRSRRRIAEGREWTFVLDPWQPALFAVLPKPVAEEDLMRHLERQPR